MILTNLHLKVRIYWPQSTTLLEIFKTRDYLRQGIQHITNTCFLMDFSGCCPNIWVCMSFSGCYRVL